MMVLTCKKGQSIILRNSIEITVLSVRGGRVQLGVSSPAELNVNWERITKEKERRNKTDDYISSLLEKE